jgi:hypothetical protein
MVPQWVNTRLRVLHIVPLSRNSSGPGRAFRKTDNCTISPLFPSTGPTNTTYILLLLQEWRAGCRANHHPLDVFLHTSSNFLDQRFSVEFKEASDVQGQDCPGLNFPAIL